MFLPRILIVTQIAIIAIYFFSCSEVVEGYRVGILATDGSFRGSSQLNYTRQLFQKTFGSSALIVVSAETPTANYLSSNFDAVLVFPDYGYFNSTALGEALATFGDAGGRIVTATFELESASLSLAGRFYPTYGCLNSSDVLSDVTTYTSNASTILWPKHPILKGIAPFRDELGQQIRTTAPYGWSAAEGAYEVFLWSDDAPLILVKDKVGPKEGSMAYIGFWPCNKEDIGNQAYYWNGSSIIGNYFRDLVLNTMQYVLDNKAYLQPDRIDLCSGTTFDVGAFLAANASYYGWDANSYSVTAQTPDALTTLQAGTYNVTYTIKTIGSTYPLNGKTTVYVTDCTTTSTSNTSSASKLNSFFFTLLSYFL